MEKELIINTVKSMRDYIKRINSEGPSYGQAWDEIQSADHLLEKLDSIQLVTARDAVMASSSAAEPYLNNLAALRGAMQSLLHRNPGIVHSRDPEECRKFTAEFMILYDSYLKPVIFPGGKNDATV